MATGSKNGKRRRRNHRRPNTRTAGSYIDEPFGLVMNCFLGFWLFCTLPTYFLTQSKEYFWQHYGPVIVPALFIIIAVWVIGGIVKYGARAIVAVPVQMCYTVIVLLGLIWQLIAAIGEAIGLSVPLFLTVRTPGAPTEDGRWHDEPSGTSSSGLGAFEQTYIAYKGTKTLFDDDDPHRR